MAKILIIEPDQPLGKTYRRALYKAGHDARVCASAQDAIFAVDKNLPDVILLEMQLVGHSGIEFLYELRSYPEWQALPVIVISNVPDGEFAGGRESLKGDLGVAAYLYKPKTNLKQLISVVEAAYRTPDSVVG